LIGSAIRMGPRSAAGDRDFASVLAGAKAGHEAAWAIVFGDLAGTVVGYLRAHGSTDPEDLASEVFLRVARSIATFEGDEAHFRSWVFTITHRLLLDEHRRAGHRAATRSLDDGRAETDAIHDASAAVPDGWSAAADDLVARRWSDEEVIALVGQLTDDQRDVVLLRIVGGFSIQEVAGLLDKPPGAIKQLQRRGLASLKRQIERRETP
jgi:RNA polymerase sigma factor (sigma-70 family)